MQEQSKIVALRLAPGDREPRRDKPSILPSLCPPELAEDLRWVLRQIHAGEPARSKPGRSNHSRRRELVWTLAATAALIATGASWWIVGANNDAGEGKLLQTLAAPAASTVSSPPIPRSHRSALPEE